MNISVTRADIIKGKRYEAGSCPIARAVKRKTHQFVIVNPSYVNVWPSKRKMLRYNLPKAARIFLHSHDGGHQVQPFTFTMKLIRQS